MPINILMPALSPTMEKGNLAKWLKKEGDKVKAGDILAEIETDKATMEYEAVDEGIVAKLLVPEGATDIAVNQPIAVLAAEGEDVKTAADASATATSATTPPKPSAASTPASAASPRGGIMPPSASPAAIAESAPPAAGKPAPSPTPAAAASNPSRSGAVPREASLSSAPPGSTAAHREAARTDGNSGRVFASPLARRLAKGAGIEIGRIAGSGPHGRVIARDVEIARKAGPALPATAAAAAPSPMSTLAPAQTPSDEKIRALFAPDSYEVVPHDSMRRIIAQRLVVAKQTIPHYYLTLTCTVDKLLATREEANAAAPKDAEGKAAWKLSINDFVIKALALALIKVPEANVTWTEAAMLRHRHADIAIAVALKGGLITPVIRKADTKSLVTISHDMRDLAERARARRLRPEEYQGGASAISNLGMYGIEEFAAVINPPQTSILAVGASEERAVVRHGKIVVATQMKATISCDHRAMDGALGAELIAAFKTYIESPLLMLV